MDRGDSVGAKLGNGRRSQADRRAETRAKLIAAAIRCLHRTGYAAVTIALIADEAGVSRGAMTYHFPSKSDIMLAVHQDAFREELEMFGRAFEATTAPEDYYLILPRVAHEALRRPAAVAVMEIMLASRADVDLRTKLKENELVFEREAQALSERTATRLGLELKIGSVMKQRIFVGALRGVVLYELIMGDDATLDESDSLLSTIARSLFASVTVEAEFQQPLIKVTSVPASNR